MSSDHVSLTFLAERPVIRDDQVSEIDVALSLLTTRGFEPQPAGYAINLCIVVDRSGSMGGEKLEQAKESCAEIYKSLGPKDRLTVLAFDDEVISVVNPQTPSGEVLQRIAALNARGQTNLSKGWYLGLLELQTYASGQHINRLILLSDGHANKGETKPSILAAESVRAREELGITTSTVGIGKDFQEDILDALAKASGGRFWFIGAARIQEIIKEEFSGALSVLMERPRLEIALPAGVKVAKDLTDLRPIGGSYRLRPVKANDEFGLAVRLQVDPGRVENKQVVAKANLFDGAGLVAQSDLIISMGSIEEYARSKVDPRVALIVNKYYSAIADEAMVAEIDAGNTTKFVEMLQAESEFIRNLEAKLAGAAATQWELAQQQEAERENERTASQQREAERENERMARDLVELQVRLQENETLSEVAQLLEIMQHVGEEHLARTISGLMRKSHKSRENREKAKFRRDRHDDQIMLMILEYASAAAMELHTRHPELSGDLTPIRERIDARLAQFS
jgi:Ca-activated chloride channel family protein